MKNCLERSIRILQYCIDNKGSDKRIPAIIEGILIAMDIIDTELKWEYKKINATRFSIFAFRQEYTRKETYNEMMHRLANDAIPILQSKKEII